LLTCDGGRWPGLEELRDIPLAILKRHPNIPATYLRRIGAKPEIYAICPIQVQRQIWQIDEELFKGRVFPLLNQYINTELDAPINEMLISTEDLVAPRRRCPPLPPHSLVVFVS
jgi:hypothetical protein